MSLADPPEQGAPSPLLTLVDLAHRARSAGGLPELGFLLVNDSLRLLSYRQAALWLKDSGIYALSGVTQVDRTTPYVQWLERVCTSINQRFPGLNHPVPLTAADLSGDEADEWNHWLPAHLLWVPIPENASGVHQFAGGGLILADDDIIPQDFHPLILEWVDTWRFAWCMHQQSYFRRRFVRIEEIRQWFNTDADMPWWKQRRIRLAIAIVVVLMAPVRQTVIAPGELVAANPVVIRAPLEGVIEQFHVNPNQPVKAGDPLFSFDEAPIASRLDVARQALATAETEYRQLAQLALNDSRSKGQLAALLGKIGEKRAEAEFIAGQFSRAKVTAPQDGIAMIDDPMEWIGRPVQTGERVMRVANPDQLEIEAWIPIGDAIPLPEKASADLYLAASPFSSVSGNVYYVGHNAISRPDGTFAYRIRATLNHPAAQRIGLKGSAKITGGWVPVCYWVLRRPLATLRQLVAL